MKSYFLVEVGHSAMNGQSLYERIRNAVFEWHRNEPMVRAVSVIPAPPKKAERRAISDNISRDAIALCQEMYADIESSSYVTIFSGSVRSEKLRAIAQQHPC